MNRIRNAWALLRVSWSVLLHDRELLWLPIMNIAATGTIFTVVALAFGTSLFGDGTMSTMSPSTFFAAAALAALLMSVSMFFEGALVAGAYQRMSGGDPTLRSAMSDSGSRIHALIGWAIINVAVGTVIRYITERAWCPVKLVAVLGSLAWEFATFLTVPAIVIDFENPPGAIRRSAFHVRNTWGENLTAHLGFGVIAAAVLVPAMILPPVLSAALGTLGVVIGAVFLGASVLTVVVGLTALTAYYKTALYLYATDGTVPEGFSRNDLQPSFLS